MPEQGWNNKKDCCFFLSCHQIGLSTKLKREVQWRPYSRFRIKLQTKPPGCLPTAHWMSLLAHLLVPVLNLQVCNICLSGLSVSPQFCVCTLCVCERQTSLMEKCLCCVNHELGAFFHKTCNVCLSFLDQFFVCTLTNLHDGTMSQ